MNKNFVAVVFLAVCPLVLAQQPLPGPSVSREQQASPAGMPVGPAALSAPVRSAAPGLLADGTIVKLKISQTISSEEAKTGQEVPFEVLEDVNVSAVAVIKKGDSAFGTVTKAESKRRMGRAGKLIIRIDYVRLADQEKVPLRATKESKGHGNAVGMTVGMAVTGVLFFPAAPLFLLMHGKDVTIPQGTEINAFVEGDANLNMAKLTGGPATPAAVPAPVTPSAVTQTSLAIDSNPAGADIEIAGAFVGSTPSTVSVASGSYQIAVKKMGFATWTRTLDVSGGAVHVSANLEPAPAQ